MTIKHFYRSIHLVWYLLLANTTFAYTHADTLRGGNGIGRYWWNVQHYDLSVSFDTAHKSITGSNTISLLVTAVPHDSMQIDLQPPMIIDSVVMDGRHIAYAHEDKMWWLTYPFHTWDNNTKKNITIYYHGSPRVAVKPPWDGGFIWTHDSTGQPWIAVACQGLGASVWWPCKDNQRDEPDSGMDMHYTVPAGLTCVSNGRLIDTAQNNTATAWHWQVKNPINNYDATFYIGDYIHWHDTLEGEKGPLDLDFYSLRSNESKAHKQFAVVKSMLHCFEYWMGPYPFYEDGYKLVDAPYLGMEHQSAVAYGNKYKMGYLGLDRSHTGVGLLFDFIIVHESGHEWFGNNITAEDITDNWLHEGFTTYSETLFTECMFGKEKADEYNQGEWANIRNDNTMIGSYGVSNENTGDIYDKGSAIIFMLRNIIHDDAKFRSMLRGLNRTFYHQAVTSRAVEKYINTFTNADLQPFFSQYLRTTNIPQLEYYTRGKYLYYRFTNIVSGFSMPIHIQNSKETVTVTPTAEWQKTLWKDKTATFTKDALVKESKSN